MTGIVPEGRRRLDIALIRNHKMLPFGEVFPVSMMISAIFVTAVRPWKRAGTARPEAAAA